MANTKENFPGPGNYKVPSRIADVAAYSSARRSDDFKHV
jgi:hypothetical protein